MVFAGFLSVLVLILLEIRKEGDGGWVLLLWKLAKQKEVIGDHRRARSNGCGLKVTSDRERQNFLNRLLPKYTFHFLIVTKSMYKITSYEQSK